MRRSLIHFWRIHLAVLLGTAVATAVLTGALLVGDSVRGSLRDLTLDRLGRIDYALVSEQFFREELASELMSDPTPAAQLEDPVSGDSSEWNGYKRQYARPCISCPDSGN